MGTSSSRRREGEREREGASGSDSPTTIELSSGMRVMVDHESREVTIMAPQRLLQRVEEEDEEEEESGSEGDEEMMLPTLGLLARLLGGVSHG